MVEERRSQSARRLAGSAYSSGWWVENQAGDSSPSRMGLTCRLTVHSPRAGTTTRKMSLPGTANGAGSATILVPRRRVAETISSPDLSVGHLHVGHVLDPARLHLEQTGHVGGDLYVDHASGRFVGQVAQGQILAKAPADIAVPDHEQSALHPSGTGAGPAEERRVVRLAREHAERLDRAVVHPQLPARQQPGVGVVDPLSPPCTMSPLRADTQNEPPSTRVTVVSPSAPGWPSNVQASNVFSGIREFPRPLYLPRIG